MRAFKLVTFVVAIFGSAYADDMEIIDHDASVETIEPETELPDPEMPPNPYGDITLEEIVRTGTLDGVRKPETPEEKEALEALMNFHAYTEASKEIDTSFDGLMEQLQMNDLNQMMADMQEELEAEFMVNELAKLNLKIEDLQSGSAIEQAEREAILNKIQEDYAEKEKKLRRDTMFDIDEIERKL